MRLLAEKAIAAQFFNWAATLEILATSASIGLRLHLVEDLLNVEGCRFLPLWEFLEGLEELSHDCLSGKHDPELIGIPTRVHPSIRCNFERVLPKVNNQGHCTRFRNIGPPGTLSSESDFPILVSERVEAARIVEVENLLALAGSFAREKIGHVIRVEVNLVRPVNAFIPLEELILHVGYTRCGEESRCPILVRGDVVDGGIWLDHAGPASQARHAEATLPGGALLSTEGRGTAVRPRKLLGAVVHGKNNDGVVGDAQVIELLQKLAYDPIEFHHPVREKTVTALVCPLWAEAGPDMHARGVVPEKERFSAFHGFVHEIERYLE